MRKTIADEMQIQFERVKECVDVLSDNARNRPDSDGYDQAAEAASELEDAARGLRESCEGAAEREAELEQA